MSFYPIDRNGDEYYPPTAVKYALNHENDEIYAKKKDGTRFYMKLNNEEFYAKDRKGDEILIRNKNEFLPVYDPNGFPIYPRKHDRNIIIPLDSKNKPVYLKDKSKNECYPKDDTGAVEQYFSDGKMDLVAKVANGVSYYATKLDSGNRMPYYPKKSGKEFYASDSGNPIYAIHPVTHDPIYITDANIELYYEQSKGNSIYAHNMQTREPKYAKIPPGDEYFALKSNLPYYATHADRKTDEYYPKLKNQKQFYMKIKNKDVYAKRNGGEYYAKDADGNELIGKDGLKDYYAKVLGSDMYPKRKDQSEFYRREDNKEFCALDKDGNVCYAKDNKRDEFYPMEEIE